MKDSVYRRIINFKKKYPLTVAFRLRKHADVIENILDEDEKVLYAFCGQKALAHNVFFSSCAIALTNKRLLVGQKRVFWGYLITSVTPDLFNDLKVEASLLWGKIIIDTAKEKLFVSNLDKASLDEVETAVNRIMQDIKIDLSEES